MARNRSSITNICKSLFSGNFVESKILQSLEKVESGIKNYTNLLENWKNSREPNIRSVRWPFKSFEVKFLALKFFQILLQIRRQKVVELAGGKKMPDFDNSIEWNTG